MSKIGSEIFVKPSKLETGENGIIIVSINPKVLKINKYFEG
jgi:hypothetical protein